MVKPSATQRAFEFSHDVSAQKKRARATERKAVKASRLTISSMPAGKEVLAQLEKIKLLKKMGLGAGRVLDSARINVDFGMFADDTQLQAMVEHFRYLEKAISDFRPTSKLSSNPITMEHRHSFELAVMFRSATLLRDKIRANFKDPGIMPQLSPATGQILKARATMAKKGKGGKFGYRGFRGASGRITRALHRPFKKDESLMQSIQVLVTDRNSFAPRIGVGIPKGLVHPENKIDMAKLARMHENGYTIDMGQKIGTRTRAQLMAIASNAVYGRKFYGPKRSTPRIIRVPPRPIFGDVDKFMGSIQDAALASARASFEHMSMLDARAHKLAKTKFVRGSLEAAMQQEASKPVDPKLFTGFTAKHRIYDSDDVTLAVQAAKRMFGSMADTIMSTIIGRSPGKVSARPSPMSTSGGRISTGSRLMRGFRGMMRSSSRSMPSPTVSVPAPVIPRTASRPPPTTYSAPRHNSAKLEAGLRRVGATPMIYGDDW